MLTDPSVALASAIKRCLLEDADVKALVADRVYDLIPNGPTFPYVSLGEIQVMPELAEGADAATSYVTLHSWDRFKSGTATRALSRAVVAALHDRDLTIEDGAVLSLLLQTSRVLPDPDGTTRHGVHVFAVLTDANA
ncbi:DUF3168 domain-containing protein [Bradyrhizobium sp. HKCCYLRH3099]|uniref:DUF3168 domain-containing protein n=1 Tax=unclassified Bradyrhizobium TaxID=2631580 RepID=UPI003EBB5A20